MSSKNKLPVTEIFPSIQGEGYFSGKKVTFLRLSGCDVGCPWCDTKYSWEAKENQYMTISQILTKLDLYNNKTIVITGGEPMMWNLDILTLSLKKKGYLINLETSGAYPVSGQFDWICLSPKKFKPVIKDWFFLANELKIIVLNKSDFLWAKKHSQKVKSECKLFVQPEWNNKIKNNSLIDNFISENKKWKLSLQMHKYLNIP